MNEYPPYRSPELKFKPSAFNNSINKNKNNLDYNRINDFSNNIYNENDENNEIANQNEDGGFDDVKEKENEKDNNDMDDIHDMTFEPEEGTKKKRRNRSGSVDDRKNKEDNVKCTCNIF